MLLYNSLSKRKEEFKPLDNIVRMYVCGITPYAVGHIGHAMTYMTFDVLNRFMLRKGWNVKYVQNITDVDDPLFRHAYKVNKPWMEVAEQNIKQHFKDMRDLNILLPDIMPKASQEMDSIIEIIDTLLHKKYAYEKYDNVYFDISKYSEYGLFSNLSEQEMIAISRKRGANPDDPNKKSKLDFILWQAEHEDDKSWESPWGKGRPGWHIECSAMAMKYLENKIDIHGGGDDLIFPHHESEIAQSECFSGKKPFARFWMHVGAVLYKGKDMEKSEKMSKSKGNLVYVQDILKQYSANTVRLFLMSHYYRIPWEFKHNEIAASESVEHIITEAVKKPLYIKKETNALSYHLKFYNALSDDLNVPAAISILKEYSWSIISNKQASQNSQKNLSEMANILGLKIQ
jgi:cysteinyl-tRNA synthetase